MTTTISVVLSLFLISSASVRFIPTSEVVKVATMVAQDEGYKVNDPGMFFDELRTKEGREPLAGYTSIALYKGGQILRSYSIRTDTGDIIDATECKIFRYSNVRKFKTKVMRDFHTSDVSIEKIASEVGCERLDVVQ